MRSADGMTTSVGTGQPAQEGVGLAERSQGLGRFGAVIVCVAWREVGADDDLAHQAVGAGCQAVSDAGIDIEAADLEISDGIDVVLLLVERQKILRRPEVGVILDPDPMVLADLVRKARRGREVDIAVLAKTEVHDRIDDELIVVLAPADDRPDLHVPLGLRKLRHRVAELEVDAVEELPLVGMGRDEQLPDLGGIGIGGQVLIDCERGVEAHLPPIGDAIGPLSGAVERMVRNQGAGKFGLLAAAEGIVHVQLKRPLPDLGDLGVIDLDLIDGAR